MTSTHSNLMLLNQIRIIMCQTSHPGNIGSTARAMKTMGLSRLYLVQPKIFPSDESTSLASGAADLLENATVCDTLEQALVGCTLVIGLSARRRQLSHELVSTRQAALKVRDLLIADSTQSQQIAILLGTEMSGLSNAELDLCQLLAMIPANPDYSSLNVAAAAQIICYELRMAMLDEHAPLSDLPNNQIKPKVDKAPLLASSDEIEHMFKHMEETLKQIGFLNIHSPGKLMQRIRRMYARVRLEKEEVNIMRGILALTQQPNPLKHQPRQPHNDED